MKQTWKTPTGKIYTFYKELLQQKHLMIAGATGSGKSVIVNGLIYTALYKLPDDLENGVQFILIDPKRVELVEYKHLPHTIKYSSEPTEMVQALQYAMGLTETRYKAMSRHSLKKWPGGHVYVIIDEFADLMATDRKQVQPIVQRLAQIGRAAGIHIILCTQCPLAKVIPTEIKVNFDSVIGLHTVKSQDSRNILGITGCELLPPFGECLYMSPGEDITHYKNIPMVSDDRIIERVKWWTEQRPRGFFSRMFGRCS